MNKKQRLAIVDIGTNSILYSCFEAAPHGLINTIDQGFWTARLGQNLTSDWKIKEKPLYKAIDIIKQILKRAESKKACKIIGVGTHVFRLALNRDWALEQITNETGIQLRILSTGEEAEASFQGALYGCPDQDTVCVIDIGGGSTECILGQSDLVVQSMSLPLGAVILTEQFLGIDIYKLKAITALQKELNQQITEKVISLLQKGERMIGVGGTITTLAAVFQHLKIYDGQKVHGTRLKVSWIQDFGKMFQSLTPVQRREWLQMDPDRADILYAGILVLEKILQKSDFSSLTVSDFGLRTGIAIQELTSLKK